MPFAIYLRPCRPLLVCLVLLAALLPAPAVAQQVEPANIIPGEIVLGWQSDAAALAAIPVLAAPPEPTPGALAVDRTSPAWRQTAAALAALTGLDVREVVPEYGVALLAVAPGREQAEIERLTRLAWVRYAEPNYVFRAAEIEADAVYPTDPSFGLQWNMRRVAGPEAWAVTRGSYSLMVAVVDSGIDQSHPEFQGRLWPGYDYVNSDNDPHDDFGHGTHVAGILAAAADNRQGVTGLAPNVRLLPLKVLDASGRGSYFNIALGIRRAADANAQVINVSLGGQIPPNESDGLAEAVRYAIFDRGALVVAAGGNCAQGGAACNNVSNGDYYPAAYPDVLAVSASDHFDNWTPYANRRPYIDLAAPGGVALDAIYSTRPGGYGYLSGTSMATPLVSAAAALVLTMQPAATREQVAAILRDTADKVGTDPDTGIPLAYVGGRNDTFGYGRLNAGRAVRWAYPPGLRADTNLVRYTLGGSVTTGSRSVRLSDPSGQSVVWQATVVDGSGWLTVTPTGNTVSYGYPSTLTLRAGPTLPAPGIYYGLVRVDALYPPGIPPVEIQVELAVRPLATGAYLPLVVRSSMPWYAPAQGGRLLLLGDNQVASEALPFPVSVFGATHTRLSISDNGLVYFGGEQPRASQPPSTCPPTAAQPNNALYVLAQDWNPGLGGQIYVQQPDADTFVVTWNEVRRAGSVMAQSFQLVLRRDLPPVAHYRTIEAAPPGFIGAENYDGTYAQQVYCAGRGDAPASGGIVTFDIRTPW